MRPLSVRVLAGAAVCALAVPVGTALADYTIKDGNGTAQTIVAFVCQTTKICPAQVLIDSTGTEKATSANPLRVDPTGTTAQPVSAASGSIADGADATQGSKSDTAYSGSGSASIVSILKGIYSVAANSLAAGTAYIGQVGLNAVASGGWTPKWFVAANSDNATNLKASAGIVHAVEVYGIGSAPAYLKFYDKASSPTCGSDTIAKQIMIPAAGTAANGAGSNAIVMDAQFSNGIAYCVVTGIAATDDTAPAAATYVVNIDYK